jgi:cell division protein FtsZ
MKGAKGVIISITGGEDMRLMEVDEAASHIKELVDPDANIIWGSAFNNDLDGKIRVSVVATGIEAEAGTQPQPGKVFSFPGRNTNLPTLAVAPAAEATATDAGSGEEEPLELGTDEDTEELMLDSDDILTQPVGAAPIAPPADEDMDIESPQAEAPAAEDEAPKAARESGTLFERMSNIARGAAQAQGEGEEPTPSFRREPLDIPRFLNRQNNQ